MKKIVNITGRVMPLLLGVLLLSSAANSQNKNPNAPSVQTDYCNQLTINVTPGPDSLGCYFDVELTQIWSAASGCNINDLPHGLYVAFSGATTINSVQILQGAWFTATPAASQSPFTNSVYWTKQPAGTCTNATNSIPSGQLLKVRIWVTTVPNPVTVTVRELTGWSWPTDPSKWNCEKVFTFPAPQVNYSIGPNTSVCSGSAMAINLSPAPPTGSTVTWYQLPSNAPCPTVNPPASPWVLAQTGGTSFNTNILTSTTCYVAVIQQGCWKYFSNVKRVDVCPGPPIAAITATPASGYPQTTIINQVAHACSSWSGQLCLNPSTFPCSTQIIRWERRTRGLSYSSPCIPVWGSWSSWVPIPSSAGQTCINTGVLGYGAACQMQYEFRAVLQNACGTSTPPYTIVIDRPPVPGNITANPLPPLCFDKATKLTYSTSCAEVVEWEKRDELSPCTNTWGSWTPIAGSQGTCVWWTNNLQTTTQYRVKVKNGACPPVYSPVYTVTVKPKLGVTISANQTVLCPPGVTLTAQTTYGPPCSYPVSYQWYQDGLPITGATSSTYSPTTPGNYYVVVSDTCGKAKSNVITVCGRLQLVIVAPCCVCPGETITVTANVLWTPANCQPPSCTYLWNTGATTPSISVTSPGTYTVTVNCGTCPPMTQSVTIQPCL